MWNPFAKQLADLEDHDDLKALARNAARQTGASGTRRAPAKAPKEQKKAKRRAAAYPTEDARSRSAAERHHHVRTNIAEFEVIGQVAVATLIVDELSQNTGVQNLSALLLELKETGAKHYVLDIQNIQYMDSMCLGCLVETLNDMAKKGGKIALASCDQNVQQLFRMTRLDRVFPICRDVMSAMTAVERVRA